MKNLFVRLYREEEGADLVEYALVMVLVALGSISAISHFASVLARLFSLWQSGMEIANPDIH